MVELVEALRDATSYYKRHLAGIDIASTHSILKSQAPDSPIICVAGKMQLLYHSRRWRESNQESSD